MRIQELRFKNLNSLYGEWHIDFSNPEYTNNGIFVLTGPTGAGKSTILDAICLALYGETPRLPSITKNNNELMSRQTGECHAEIIFTSQAGTFLCRWEQRRAKKKATGALQAPEHQISEAYTGKILETSRAGVLKLVEEKTGMDYDRFTRSILLAQGNFDVFLKAKTEEKSSILEQITGTEIYSEISRLVHEKQRAEKENLTILLAENSHVVLLTEEQEKAIGRALLVQSAEEKKISIEKNSLQNSIIWRKNILSLSKELQDIATQKEQFATEIQNFSSEKARLEIALKANELDSNFSKLNTIREQQKKDNDFIKSKTESLPVLENAFRQSDVLEKEAIQNTISCKTELQKNAPLFQQTRLLDQRLAMEQKNILEQKKLCEEEQKKINSQKKYRVDEENKEKKCQEYLKLSQEWLEEHKKDEWLIGELGTVIEQLKALFAMQQEGVQIRISEKKEQETLKAHTIQLEKYTIEIKKQKNDLEILSKELNNERKSLESLLDNKLLREYHTQKETLLREKILVQQIINLEDYRKALEDDKPCPLCGAYEHPYAKGNIPELSAIDKQIIQLEKRIGQAEKLELKIKNLEQQVQKIQTEQLQTTNLEQITKKDSENTRLKLKELTEYIDKSIQNYRTKEKEILELLSPLGIVAIPSNEISDFHASLQTRLELWQQKNKEKQEFEKQNQSILAEIKKYEALIKDQEAVQKESQEKLTNLEKEFLKKQQERTLLLTDKSVDEEEKRLQNNLYKAEQTETHLKTSHAASKNNLDSVKTSIQTLKQQIDSRQSLLQKTEQEFQQVLKIHFENEQAYHNASLMHEERNALMQKAKIFEDKEKEFISMQKDREQRLTLEQAKKLCDDNVEELEIKFATMGESLALISESIIKNRHYLETDKQAKQKFKDKQQHIEKQKKEVQRWEKLHTLIGSADGKKYRNFAQGLTFELMVSHANKQLNKMSDRYLLIRDENEPLALNVIDNYQGGEIRSTLNLSGGESFITSLALALGLSKMASQKVRVDSLFLDEGFGTLDEEALETALDTLSTIQQDGKLIGIISHVPALKERISTQIRIEPTSGGKSIISGPACSKVE